jgi:antitoxin PrlF
MNLQTASAKGQVTIPIKIRKKLGIEAGTPIRFVERDGVVVLEKVNTSLSSLCGMFTARMPMNLDEIDDQVASAVAEKVFGNGAR